MHAYTDADDIMPEEIAGNLLAQLGQRTEELEAALQRGDANVTYRQVKLNRALERVLEMWCASEYPDWWASVADDLGGNGLIVNRETGEPIDKASLKLALDVTGDWDKALARLNAQAIIPK